MSEETSEAPPLESGYDPLRMIPNNKDLIVATTNELRTKYSKLFSLLNKKGVRVDNLDHITVFGPGLSELQGILEALSDNEIELSNLEVDVVDGDPHVSSSLSEYTTDAKLNFRTTTFAKYLDRTSTKTNIIFVCNTGPSTTSIGIGITKDRFANLKDRMHEGGIIITRGEIGNLYGYLQEEYNQVAEINERGYSIKVWRPN